MRESKCFARCHLRGLIECAHVRPQAKGTSPAMPAALTRQVGTWAGLFRSRVSCSCAPSPSPPASFWWAGQQITDRVQVLCGAIKSLFARHSHPASLATCSDDPLQSSSPPSSLRRSTSIPALLLVL